MSDNVTRCGRCNCGIPLSNEEQHIVRDCDNHEDGIAGALLVYWTNGNKVEVGHMLRRLPRIHSARFGYLVGRYYGPDDCAIREDPIQEHQFNILSTTLNDE